MRNVTVSIDDAVADWSKVWAATHQTSVSRMLGELLAEKMAEEESYTAAMEEYLAVQPVVLTGQAPASSTTSPYPRRDMTHKR
jgi:hypothetical protein